MTDDRAIIHPNDLRESGLLWLINRVVFHPRGFALAMAFRDNGEFLGWVLQGDGTESWDFDDHVDMLARVNRLLAPRGFTEDEP